MKNFIFRKEWLDMVSSIRSDQAKLELYNAIVHYVLEGEEISMSYDTTKVAMVMVKMQIEQAAQSRQRKRERDNYDDETPAEVAAVADGVEDNAEEEDNDEDVKPDKGEVAKVESGERTTMATTHHPRRMGRLSIGRGFRR